MYHTMLRLRFSRVLLLICNVIIIIFLHCSQFISTSYSFSIQPTTYCRHCYHTSSYLKYKYLEDDHEDEQQQKQQQQVLLLQKQQLLQKSKKEDSLVLTKGLSLSDNNYLSSLSSVIEEYDNHEQNVDTIVSNASNKQNDIDLPRSVFIKKMNAIAKDKGKFNNINDNEFLLAMEMRIGRVAMITAVWSVVCLIFEEVGKYYLQMNIVH